MTYCTTAQYPGVEPRVDVGFKGSEAFGGNIWGAFCQLRELDSNQIGERVVLYEHVARCCCGLGKV